MVTKWLNARVNWRGVTAAVAVVALAACSDDRARLAFEVAGEPAAAVVSAIDNTFRQPDAPMVVGTEIVFSNDGRNDHNIVPSDGSDGWGVGKEEFGPGAEYRHTFVEPGVYEYFCSIHGTAEKGMTGSLTVVESGEDQAAAGSGPAPSPEPTIDAESELPPTDESVGASGDEPAAEASAPGTEGEPPPATEPAAVDAAGPNADGVIEVPGELSTIQAAVDAAAPGDLVLIAPGTYHEAVNVTTNDLTIRGLDRNTVILDGEQKLDNGIRILDADGVALENMTATNYTANGFFWTGSTGYRGSYLSAYRTGDYGVYAFDSVKGQLEHIYAAGSPDAGVYIGQCYPCDAVIDDVLSEHNGLGYSGTNSGGNLLIVNSVFRYNRAGVVPNSGSYELCYPERDTTIVGNLVYSNNQGDTPAIDVALLAMGNGILSAGGVRNVIERNQVYDHAKSGIGLVPFLEDDANDVVPPEESWDTPCDVTRTLPVTKPEGSVLWDSMQTRVVGNEVSASGQIDLLVASAGGDLSTFGHCFDDNVFSTSAPLAIETLAPCSGDGAGDWSDGEYNIVAWLAEQHPPSVDWKIAPLPPLVDQPSMPDAATAPARPATDVPSAVDLAAITVPAKAAG